MAQIILVLVHHMDIHVEHKIIGSMIHGSDNSCACASYGCSYYCNTSCSAILVLVHDSYSNACEYNWDHAPSQLHMLYEHIWFKALLWQHITWNLLLAKSNAWIFGHAPSPTSCNMLAFSTWWSYLALSFGQLRPGPYVNTCAWQLSFAWHA